MNKDLCISTMNAINPFHKQHEAYETHILHLQEEEITPATFLEIHETAKKRMEELDKLKTMLSKLEGVIHPDSYKKLMSSIENEEALASMLASDSEQFLETQDTKYEESILTGLAYEREYNIELVQSLAMVEKQMGIMIVGSVFKNQMSLEDIKELSNSLEKGSPFQVQMEELMNHMIRTQVKEEEAQIENPESTSEIQPEEQEQEKEEPELVVSAPKAPTLADKISQIQYFDGRNIVAEVQALTVEERMAQIAATLAALMDKEKLSLRDMIQIQSLQEEQVQLEAYVEALNDQKLSRSEVRRNKKMEIATSKIEENKQLIAQSMANSKEYRSKIARFMSARYQENLALKVANLREKRGVIQEKQKMSAIAKYNRKSGRIIRSSRVLGTVRGLSQFTNLKIEELRALRDQVVTEFSNMKQDMGRFRSNRDRLPELQEAQVVMPDNIVSLDEYRRMQEQTLAA